MTIIRTCSHRLFRGPKCVFSWLSWRCSSQMLSEIRPSIGPLAATAWYPETSGPPPHLPRTEASFAPWQRPSLPTQGSGQRPPHLSAEKLLMSWHFTELKLQGRREEMAPPPTATAFGALFMRANSRERLVKYSKTVAMPSRWRSFSFVSMGKR